MRQQHGIDACGIHRQRRPVLQAQLLVALEQTAVDQQPPLAGLQQVLRAGDRARGAQEGKVHVSPAQPCASNSRT